jgi:hypothetical protein
VLVVGHESGRAALARRCQELATAAHGHEEVAGLDEARIDP